MAGGEVNVSNPAGDDLINESLRDDELRGVLGALECQKDKDTFGLVCKRWLLLQSNERRKLSARAGPHMLKKMAARFTRLCHLDLSQSASRSFYPGVTDSDLAVIAANFVCLTSLDLHNCKGITDAGLATIGSGLSTLQFLDVSDCKKLTGKGLSAVAAGCPALKSLHLAGCKFVTDALLRALSNNCHHLEELGLQGCTNITDFGLAVLGEGCQRLKYLDINKCSNVGDMGVSSISKACSASLRTLKLLDCYRLGDESMLSVANFCKNLETLIIGGCRNISDESIKTVAVACCVNLKVLRMDWCLNLSDSSLNCIFSRCKSLEILDIGCCNEVTDAAFQGLDTEGFELALKILKIDNCAKITVAGIELLLKWCKSLEYIDVRSCPHVTKTACNEAGLQFPGCCKVNFTGSLADPDILI